MNCGVPHGSADHTRATSKRFDSGLPIIVTVHCPIRDYGGEPSSREMDELFYERNEIPRKLTLLAEVVTTIPFGARVFDRLEGGGYPCSEAVSVS